MGVFLWVVSMTYGFPSEEKKSGCKNCLLYAILFVVISNLFISGFLAYGLYVVSTQGESEAKRISNEIVADRLQALREYLSVPEHRQQLGKELSSIIKDVTHEVAPDITKVFSSEVANALIPYDVFSIAEYLLNYNFNPIAELLAGSLHSASQSFMKIPRYQDGAEVVSAIAAVVDIVAGVQPLSDSTDPPSTTEYSLLGQTLLRLPETVTNSLTQSSWTGAARDCATLANRLYFTDFTGSYDSVYGPMEFNLNEGVKPVFSNIYDICLTLANSPAVESS